MIEGIFHWMMILLIVIPVILFMDYVYYNDNQAQGRYLMPALYPLMYFVTLGWNKILTKVIKNEKVRGWIYKGNHCFTRHFTVCMLGISYSTVLCEIKDESLSGVLFQQLYRAGTNDIFDLLTLIS